MQLKWEILLIIFHVLYVYFNTYQFNSYFGKCHFTISHFFMKHNIDASISMFSSVDSFTIFENAFKLIRKCIFLFKIINHLSSL